MRLWPASLGCPEIFSLEVVEDLRGRGIGKQLMASLEQCVRDRRLLQVGLGVALENIGALRLYRRLGYYEAAVPSYVDRWEWIDSSGQSHTEADPCIFLIKDLQ
jgi:GNAT superfamily N-acetyltransferase